MKNRNEQLKLEELRKNNKDLPYTFNTGKHIPTGFVISVCHSPDAKYKENKYSCYRGENCLVVFVEKTNKYLSNFSHFKRINK